MNLNYVQLQNNITKCSLEQYMSHPQRCLFLYSSCALTGSEVNVVCLCIFVTVEFVHGCGYVINLDSLMFFKNILLPQTEQESRSVLIHSQGFFISKIHKRLLLISLPFSIFSQLTKLGLLRFGSAVVCHKRYWLISCTRIYFIVRNHLAAKKLFHGDF